MNLSDLEECRAVAKKSEVVAQAIVHDIVREGLQPGDRLASEAEMMEQYDVGRGSLREALRVLELNGLVSLKPGPGGGPVVESVNPTVLGRMLTLYLHVSGATYRELVDARLALEPTCAALAATVSTSEERASLAKLGERAHDVDLNDDAAYRAMSNEFHGAVVAMSGNRILELLAQSMMEIFDAHIAASDARRAHPDGRAARARRGHRGDRRGRRRDGRSRDARAHGALRVGVRELAAGVARSNGEVGVSGGEVGPHPRSERPVEVGVSGTLDGKVAVVTGAGRMRSIGRPIAVELAKAGCDVVITGSGRPPESYPEDEQAVGWRDIQSVAEEIEAEGRRALALVNDVTDAGAVDALADRVMAEFGRVDIVVNNAGAAPGRTGSRWWTSTSTCGTT